MAFCLLMIFLIFEEPITNWINAKAEELRARSKKTNFNGDYEQ